MPEETIDRPRDQRKAAFVTAISGRNNTVESIMTGSQNGLGAFYSLSDFWKVVIGGVEDECAIKKGVDARRRRHKNGDGDKSVSRVFPHLAGSVRRVRLEVMIMRHIGLRTGIRSYLVAVGEG